MAAPSNKKTLLKKDRQPVARKKVTSSRSKKRSVKPSGKVNKTVAAKKKQSKRPSPQKAAAAKKIGKKTAVTKKVGKKAVAKKPLKRKKPQEKTVASKDRLVDLRKSLLRKKETILKEVKEEMAKHISGENKQLIDTANDEGDWAQIDISEDLSLKRLSAHRKLTYNIEEALSKIAAGTYGICEDCGEEISEKRLLVLPTATLCIDCQEQKEQLEAFEGEE